ncbi:tyrosine-type recombinase/integrase [Dysosmobacter sp.]|uniref:tyrosine-type recombinase/integrase n=1 Tax=Dysosmobacter sp. TaxID=2591382 RepID=UPI003AF0509F
MKPRQKGKQWEISYRCPGYSKPIYERFAFFEEAKLRIAEIEYEKSIGMLRPPKVLPSQQAAQRKKFITLGELMDEYVQLYGINHWGDSYLSQSRHRIEHYIKPYLGHALVQDLTTHDLDLYYNDLMQRPAIPQKGHKSAKNISPKVIEKIHGLLRSALNQAVAWGYIQVNPANHATIPEYEKGSRTVWTAAEAQCAITLCDNPILRLALLLAVGRSMRIGEILGLTWSHVEITPYSISAGNACLLIDRELKRCDKSSLADLEKRGRSKVYLTFPEIKQLHPCKTVLTLKAPKTSNSIRNICLPATVAHALSDMRAQQAADREQMGDAYTDYDLVIAHEDGRPYEERQIADLLRRLIVDHDLPPVVFHSLRHYSTSLKLQLSKDNIKAVQGDTGHAQARMVTDLYVHADTEARRKLAQKVEQDFFRQKDAKTEKAADDDAQRTYQLLQTNPEIAKLILSIMGQSAS